MLSSCQTISSNLTTENGRKSAWRSSARWRGIAKKRKGGCRQEQTKTFFFIAVKRIAISNYLLVDISAGNGRSGTGVQALLSMLA
jgi:hypothetical protein